MVFESVFMQIGIIVGLAAMAGLISQFLRQPLIVAFIALGVFLGPSGISLVSASSEIELFARLGIALLLFVVGLKLDMNIIRTVGPVALASGLGQVLFTSAAGFLIAIALGITPVSAVYVAIALTFSSTIIIIKLLSDKREVNTLHGRIAIGFLIVQDIVVVLVMIGLTALGQANDTASLGQEALMTLLKGIFMLLTVIVLIRLVLPRLLPQVAHSSELLMLFSIAWAILGAGAGQALGFSKEVGAFLAGISIASTPYREQVAARMTGLRDFLLLFFFIELGSSLDLSILGAQVPAALLFSAFVLIGNPLIVMSIMGYMGYRKRTSFLAGLTVAQISEFSLILTALGYGLGHISQEIVGLVTLVGLITISASTYMILYSQTLYEWLAPLLSIFERKLTYRESSTVLDDDNGFEVIIIGLGRFGTVLAENLQKQGKKVLAVDCNPKVVEQYTSQGYVVHYGDIEDPELVSSLPIQDISLVVSTVRDRMINRALIDSLHRLDYRGKISVCVSNTREIQEFEKVGADFVLSPYEDAAHKATDRLMQA